MNQMLFSKISRQRSGQLRVCKRGLLKVVRVMIMLLLVWIQFFGSIIPAHASRDTDYLSVRTVSVAEGLHSTWVFRVFQDRSGFIWLACWGGMTRFDGTSVVNYSHREGLPGGTLYTAVHQLSDGSLIVGSVFEGVFQLKGSSWVRIPVNDEIFRDGIEDLIQDQNGHIWFASRRGIWRGRLERGCLKVDLAGFDEMVTRCLMLDQEGNVWMGGTGVFAKWSHDKWQTFRLPAGAGSAMINSMKMHDDVIWMATSAGVYRFEPHTGAMRPIFVPRKDPVTRSVLVQDNGTVWVSGRNGLYVRRNRKWTHYTDENGLSGENLGHLFRDSAANIWIPSRTDGVMVTAPGRFENYRSFGVDSGRYVKGLFQDKDGTLWVGTEKGLYVRKSEGWRRVPLSTEPPERSIYGILRLPDGSLLVTSYLRVDRLTDNGCEDLKARYDLPDATYLAPRLDQTGRLWMATINSGLIVLDDGGWRQVSVGAGTGMSEAVYCSSVGANGNLLFGTYDGRVLELNGDNLSPVLPEQCALQVPIQALLEDNKGSLWIGTAGEGLYRFHDGNLEAHNPETGFPATQCTSLGMVGDHLIVGTNHGLVVTNEGRWVLYDESNGLPGVEFQIGAVASLLDGRLALGTDRGLTIVGEGFLDRPPQQVPIRLTAIRNGREDIRTVVNPSISSGASDMQFTFVGLEFLSPHRLRYRYMLYPEDDAWTETDVRQVHYRSLSPGSHVFRVQATGPAGAWGPAEEFHFSVVPAFWQTSWFLLVAALGLSVLGGLTLKGTRVGFNRLLVCHQRNWFAHFRLRSVLGRGGMAVVYRAWNRKTRATVALKILNTGVLDSEGETRFIREGIISAHLAHPNIVPVLDHGIHNSRPWLELELVQGKTLTELVRKGGPFSVRYACGVITVLLDVIADVHTSGILHRDLKPDNVMMSDGELQSESAGTGSLSLIRDRLRILDFGIARFMDARTVTRMELDSGTPLFRPPEAFFGENRSSCGVDVYAVGMIFYYLLTGHFPYESESNDPAETIGQILYRDALSVGHWCSDVPEQLDRLVMSMIHKDSDRRQQDIRIIRERVHQIMEAPV